MSLHGTAAHDSTADLPPLVRRAVAAARAHGFEYSCRPEQGRLLRLLAAGARARIGETGTGYGVGLAWLASGAAEGVRLTSVERDPERAAAAEEVFADQPQVEVLQGDWQGITDRGPFDLLVLDGGGQGKTDEMADPSRLLTAGGVVVVDDFTPATTWPPVFDGSPDDARIRWLTHPDLHSAELPLAADLGTVVGTYLPTVD
jgi:predicted O-methyltransferase YrrM